MLEQNTGHTADSTLPVIVELVFDKTKDQTAGVYMSRLDSGSKTNECVPRLSDRGFACGVVV